MPRTSPALAAASFAALILVRLALPVRRGDNAVSPVTALAHVPRFVREPPMLNDYSFGCWTPRPAPLYADKLAVVHVHD